MSHVVECLILPAMISFCLFLSALKFIVYFYVVRKGIQGSHMLSIPLNFFSYNCYEQFINCFNLGVICGR